MNFNTGVCGRRLTARSTLNDSRSEHPSSPVIYLQTRRFGLYNGRRSDKRPRDGSTSGGMAQRSRPS